MPTEEEFAQLVLFLKTLADKSRLRILGLVSGQEYTVEEIAALLELKEPTVSHHLNKLKEAGLVAMRPQGTAHVYSLRQEQLSAMLRDLSPKAIQEVADDLDTPAFDRKVLQSFFADGRLKEIPAHLKKRQVVLRRLVQEFEPHTRYSEKQVNEVLKAFHEDTATLRREFIANRLMARENGVYWRLDAEQGLEGSPA